MVRELMILCKHFARSACSISCELNTLLPNDVVIVMVAAVAPLPATAGLTVAASTRDKLPYMPSELHKHSGMHVFPIAQLLIQTR